MVASFHLWALKAITAMAPTTLSKSTAYTADLQCLAWPCIPRLLFLPVMLFDPYSRAFFQLLKALSCLAAPVNYVRCLLHLAGLMPLLHFTICLKFHSFRLSS